MRFTIKKTEPRKFPIESIPAGEYFMDWNGDLFRKTGSRASGCFGQYTVGPDQPSFMTINQADGSLFTFRAGMEVCPVKQTKDAEFKQVD